MQLCLALCAERLDAWGSVLSTQRCCHYWVEVVHVEGVFAEKLAAACGVSFLVAGAEVLADEGSVKLAQVNGPVRAVRTCGSPESRSCRSAWGCLHSVSICPSRPYPAPRAVQSNQRTVQLVPVQVLSSRIALPTALVRTLKLLVQPFPTPPPLPRSPRLTIHTFFA